MENEKYIVRVCVEGNRITAVQLQEFDEEKGRYTLSNEKPETALYCLVNETDLLKIVEEYEEKLMKMAAAEVATREMEFQDFTSLVFSEAFEQLEPNPWNGFKLFITRPITRLMIKIGKIESDNKAIRYIQLRFLPAVRRIIMAFIFGPENAKQVNELLEEGRKKYLEI